MKQYINEICIKVLLQWYCKEQLWISGCNMGIVRSEYWAGAPHDDRERGRI